MSDYLTEYLKNTQNELIGGAAPSGKGKGKGKGQVNQGKGQGNQGKGKGKGKGPPPPPPLIKPKPLSKYDRMIKFGVPTNAVQNKKQVDGKINAQDLQSVTLKKTITNENNKDTKDNDTDDVPYLIELLSKLDKYRVN